MLRIGSLAVLSNLFVALLLAGCSADSWTGARVLAVPGKSEWKSCEDLLALYKSHSANIAQLQATMAKAARDAGGGFVNATVHQPKLAGLKAERRLIADSMANKGCAPPAPQHTAQAAPRKR